MWIIRNGQIQNSSYVNYWFIQLLIQSWFISFKLSGTKKTYPDFKEKIG